jgi:hypothetical protein
VKEFVFVILLQVPQLGTSRSLTSIASSSSAANVLISVITKFRLRQDILRLGGFLKMTLGTFENKLRVSAQFLSMGYETFRILLIL